MIYAYYEDQFEMWLEEIRREALKYDRELYVGGWTVEVTDPDDEDYYERYDFLPAGYEEEVRY